MICMGGENYKSYGINYQNYLTYSPVELPLKKKIFHLFTLKDYYISINTIWLQLFFSGVSNLKYFSVLFAKKIAFFTSQRNNRNNFPFDFNIEFGVTLKCLLDIEIISVVKSRKLLMFHFLS